MGCYESKRMSIKSKKYMCNKCNCEAERLYSMCLNENEKIIILLCINNHKTRVKV